MFSYTECADKCHSMLFLNNKSNICTCPLYCFENVFNLFWDTRHIPACFQYCFVALDEFKEDKLIDFQ